MSNNDKTLGAMFYGMFVLMVAGLGSAVGYAVSGHQMSGFWLGFILGAVITVGGTAFVLWLAMRGVK